MGVLIVARDEGVGQVLVDGEALGGVDHYQILYEVFEIFGSGYGFGELIFSLLSVICVLEYVFVLVILAKREHALLHMKERDARAPHVYFFIIMLSFNLGRNMCRCVYDREYLISFHLPRKAKVG